jgi:hypothetical protein
LKIHVGSLDTRTGVYHFASRTAEGLAAKMAAHVRGKLALPGELPELAGLPDGEVLRRYVELRGGDDADEWYDTSEVELEDAPEGRVRGQKPRMLKRFKAQPLRPGVARDTRSERW